MTEESYLRLHITPLTPELLGTILPSQVLPNARNLSYHTVQTFPEKSYGFVDLPYIDAESIKKKLHGSIVKGTKMRIQAARPKPERASEEESRSVSQPKLKKIKRSRNELPAIEIGQRKVKRGWTTPAQDLKKSNEGDIKMNSVVRSKFTAGAECLFKTVLPENIASKNSSFLEKTKHKNKKRNMKGIVVHEFENTIKHNSFLRPRHAVSTSNSVAQFVEGKGWLNEDGILVEGIKASQRKSTIEKEEAIAKNLMPKSDTLEDQDRHNSSPKNLGTCKNLAQADTTDEGIFQKIPAILDVESICNEIDENSTNSSISFSNSLSDHEDDRLDLNTVPFSASKTSSHKSFKTSSSIHSSASLSTSSPNFPSHDWLTSQEDSACLESRLSGQSTPHATNVNLSIQVPLATTHPLEALYKKSKSQETSNNSTFKFFTSKSESDSNDFRSPSPVQQHISVPLTPYTRRDIEHRTVRSAAPTPDTAHANKCFKWSKSNDDDFTEEDEDDDKPEKDASVNAVIGTSGNAHKLSAETRLKEVQSEFQKWFWENRGHANRNWKQRRRSALKERRQSSKKAQ
ncbi:BgTH12-07251 [Blumeria graminis f. sp. triticale]|uniref:BgTH12-07251 n=1 Tax=Blumeria graminis f. sp. triticale TaxID=1689686 RepID=A0A9W4DEH2_BLUGR|nr:BgTH12-07251 [Blumeria graminis f. sp. triticale]